MISIFLLALAGFVNAYFLHWQFVRFIKTKKPMFCLMGEDCALVIGSVYGATLGIKNEIIGMWYYTLVGLLSLVFTFSSLQVGPLIFIITLLAAAFSLYLFYAQVVLLKNLCSWCLIAIVTNILIFILATTLAF